MSHPALITAMGRPELYPHHPPSVTLIQTHISYVFLAGEHVYKVKKPVRFSFLDFSTPAQRKHFCQEEVRLNRRLAPDVYVGVIGVCGEQEGYRFCAADDPGAVEYAVHMRRLPADRTLEQLVDHGEATPDIIDALATRLVAFHRDADASPQVAANGDPATIWRILADNYSNAERFRGSIIAPDDDDAIQSFSRTFLDRNEASFRARQATGRIRDGHGDLHTDHIYCTTPLVIVDCIEFNTLFRYCDVASDLAFTAMDLDYHGRADLAQRLVDRYVAASADTTLRQLLPFYQCYRAYVRGKVDSLKSVEPEVSADEQGAAADSARRHFALAYRYTWAYSSSVVVIAGLSGTGKSAVAAALSARTGFAHINSDVVRKRLAGLPPTARGDASLYAMAHSERTYDTMMTDATAALAAGRGTILDATFQLRRGRDAARAIAAQYHVPFLCVECTCAEEVVQRRLTERVARNDSPSDADWDIYREQRRQYEPFAPDESDAYVRLDTDTDLAALTGTIETALRQRATSAAA